MIDRIRLERSFLGFPLSVWVCSADSDLLVAVTGGCHPHIGSVSGAYWENSSVRCETSVGVGHRDDVVSRRFAEALARTFQCNVSVSCGIHYDVLSRKDLDRLLAELDTLLEELIAHLSA